MVYSLIRTGAFEIFGTTQKDGQAVLEKRPGRLNELHGMLGFIDSIDVYNRTHTSDCPSDEMSSEKVYQEFLIYSNFYAAPAPVVICEGKTDNVYLTHAIRSLVADFPDLAEVMPDNKIRLKVRLYKYVSSSAARLLRLNDGGSDRLSNFIAAYRRKIKRFAGPGPTNPVIILYDNDTGAQSIWNAIKKISQRRPTGKEPFVHVIKNMYAVPTPGTSSKIEDFFDATTKETLVKGKRFSDRANFDVDKHYGKTIFAHKVVRPKADTIDFKDFRPLLTNLVAVINEHKTSISLPN